MKEKTVSRKSEKNKKLKKLGDTGLYFSDCRIYTYIACIFAVFSTHTLGSNNSVVISKRYTWFNRGLIFYHEIAAQVMQLNIQLRPG